MRGRCALVSEKSFASILIFDIVPTKNNATFVTLKFNMHLTVLEMTQLHQIAKMNSETASLSLSFHISFLSN